MAGTKAPGHGRRDADQDMEGSVMKLAQQASRLIMHISIDQPDLRFSSTASSGGCVADTGEVIAQQQSGFRGDPVQAN